MVDVLISYARKDVFWVKVLVDGLRKRGVRVWYDKHMRLVDTPSKAIQDQLKEAKYVIVLWSKHSIISERVDVEARFADGRNKLISARIDHVELLLDFGSHNTFDLVTQDGHPSWSGFNGLLDEVESLLTEKNGKKKAIPKTSNEEGRGQQTKYSDTAPDMEQVRQKNTTKERLTLNILESDDIVSPSVEPESKPENTRSTRANRKQHKKYKEYTRFYPPGTGIKNSRKEKRERILKVSGTLTLLTFMFLLIRPDVTWSIESSIPEVGFVDSTYSFTVEKSYQVLNRNFEKMLPDYEVTWEFHDGTSSVGRVAYYTYRKPGTYVVTRKVCNPMGCRVKNFKVDIFEKMHPNQKIPR